MTQNVVSGAQAADTSKNNCENRWLKSCNIMALKTNRYTPDRPVIICMVGDHAPSIISQIPAEKERSSAREQLDKRVIPYVIWSNYGADLSACPEYTNTFGLMPEVLRAAGLPLTPFYRAVLDMKREFPVFISSGLVMGADGSISSYDPADPAYRSVTEYLYMEYNAMTAQEDYREELFLPENG